MRWGSIPLLAVASIVPALALTPLSDFNVTRYHGRWYEISSSATRCVPSPRNASDAALIAFTAPIALRSMLSFITVQRSSSPRAGAECSPRTFPRFSR